MNIYTQFLNKNWVYIFIFQASKLLNFVFKDLLTSLLLLIKLKVFYLLILEAEPWKDKPHEDDDDHFKYLKFPRDDLKFKRYDKEDREPAKFIDKK